MALEHSRSEEPAAPAETAKVSWWPDDVERVRGSRIVERSRDHVERELRIHPEHAIRLAYGRDTDGEGTIVPLAAHPLLKFATVPVKVQAQSPTEPQHGAVISICWGANRLRPLFPTMIADLTVRSLSAERCELDLEGHYRPPLGLLGLIGDRLVGRWFATHTVEAFLDRLAAGLADQPRSRRGSTRPGSAAAPAGPGERRSPQRRTTMANDKPDDETRSSSAHDATAAERSDEIDEAGRESFPASDPPGWTCGR